jgi:hypothetical protein
VFEIDANSFCTVLEYCDGHDLDFYLKQVSNSLFVLIINISFGACELFFAVSACRKQLGGPSSLLSDAGMGKHFIWGSDGAI